MKVILYMAISADGFICDVNGVTPWSDEEFKEFYKFVKKSGNLIIGRKTYEIMKKNGEIKNIKDVKIIVVSRKLKLDNEDINCVDSPDKAVELLLKNGFVNLIIGGGAELNTSFMKEKLIDGVILDVEPAFLGKGKRIFTEGRFENMLEFISEKNISGFMQTRYKVRK